MVYLLVLHRLATKCMHCQSLNNLFCNVFTAVVTILFKVPAIMGYKKSRSWLSSVLSASIFLVIKTSQSSLSILVQSTRKFHSISPRKCLEIHGKIFGWMESALYLTFVNNKIYKKKLSDLVLWLKEFYWKDPLMVLLDTSVVLSSGSGILQDQSQSSTDDHKVILCDQPPTHQPET